MIYDLMNVTIYPNHFNYLNYHFKRRHDLSRPKQSLGMTACIYAPGNPAAFRLEGCPFLWLEHAGMAAGHSRFGTVLVCSLFVECLLGLQCTRKSRLEESGFSRQFVENYQTQGSCTCKARPWRNEMRRHVNTLWWNGRAGTKGRQC